MGRLHVLILTKKALRWNSIISYNIYITMYSYMFQFVVYFIPLVDLIGKHEITQQIFLPTKSMYVTVLQ